MMIEPKIRGFICTTAHPEGLKAAVQEDIRYIKSQKSVNAGKNVLIIGASMGYGLAARVAAAFGGKASTLGIIFDRPAAGARTASAGYYNTAAFEEQAIEEGLYAKTLNMDAFSFETKKAAADIIEKDLKKIDLVVYSVASPRRICPDGSVYTSVLKTVGEPYTNQTIDLKTNEIAEVTIEPASKTEIEATVKVMGGEDWKDWIDYLGQRNLLSEHAVTVAFSYIGPKMTHAMYKDGSIGQAKNHLVKTSDEISASGRAKAYVSVNKALVTQSSSAIPIVPLYITILFKIMKEMNCHEGCIEQMYRLFADKSLLNGAVTDQDGLIRLDDKELQEKVQSAVEQVWNRAGEKPLREISDLNGYKKDFERLFGFGVKGVDYTADAETDKKIPSLE